LALFDSGRTTAVGGRSVHATTIAETANSAAMERRERRIFAVLAGGDTDAAAADERRPRKSPVGHELRGQLADNRERKSLT
jgi:hypothetical protein